MEPTDLSGFSISTQTAPAGNPNTEIRNPKQIQMTEIQMSKI